MIGPSFAAELADAGLDLSVAFAMWQPNGTYDISKLTAPQQAIFQQVLAAHDPSKPKRLPLALQVDNLRNARLAAGYADATTGKTWQCDPVSIGNWTALAASAQPWALGLVTANAPTFSPWGTDNVPVSLTAAQCYALFAARVMPWVNATFAYARSMKAAIAAGTPPADLTQGWP